VAANDLPAGLDRRTNVERVDPGLWVRRALLTLLLLFVVAALLNVFGQVSATKRAAGPEAEVKVRVPDRLRGGDVFQARFDVTARADLKQPKLVLGRGWFDGFTLNSTTPQPSNESTRNGDVVFSFDQLKAGETLSVWLEFQVNPTNAGRREQDVELDDLSRPIARIHHVMRVFP
jgi:hypothetical protein